jgi:hypothetical protein
MKHVDRFDCMNKGFSKWIPERAVYDGVRVTNCIAIFRESDYEEKT